MADKSTSPDSQVTAPNVKFMKQYETLGALRKYPPFSTNIDTTEEFLEDLHGATRSVSSRVNAARDSSEPVDEGSADFALLFEGAFESVEEKWGDDLDIARLYQKRYGSDYYSAQEEALQSEGLTPESPNVPSLD